MYEKSAYTTFVKYVREVASGRSIVSLENTLEFVTGSSEECVLGFGESPTIQFVVPEMKEAQEYYLGEPRQKKKCNGDFLPKAHTCPNTLHLARGSNGLD